MKPYKKKEKKFLHHWIELLQWYRQAKTLYDIHAPSAYELACLFLQLKKGDRKRNQLLLERFGGSETAILYLTKKELSGLKALVSPETANSSEILIYAENFRRCFDPVYLLEGIPDRKFLMIEGADQFLLLLKPEPGEQQRLPLIAYRWKFWRAGFWGG